MPSSIGSISLGAQCSMDDATSICLASRGGKCLFSAMK